MRALLLLSVVGRAVSTGTQAALANRHAHGRRLDAVPEGETWWSQNMGGPYLRGAWTPLMTASGIHFGGAAWAQYDETWYNIAQGAISTDGSIYYGFLTVPILFSQMRVLEISVPSFPTN
jgi:hypothetical protein